MPLEQVCEIMGEPGKSTNKDGARRGGYFFWETTNCMIRIGFDGRDIDHLTAADGLCIVDGYKQTELREWPATNRFLTRLFLLLAQLQAEPMMLVAWYFTG
jgi:hypothetical protein